MVLYFFYFLDVLWENKTLVCLITDHTEANYFRNKSERAANRDCQFSRVEEEMTTNILGDYEALSNTSEILWTEFILKESDRIVLANHGECRAYNPGISTD